MKYCQCTQISQSNRIQIFEKFQKSEKLLKNQKLISSSFSDAKMLTQKNNVLIQFVLHSEKTILLEKNEKGNLIDVSDTFWRTK